MPRNVKSSNKNKTISSSNETIDSIQAAFDSLDAASNLYDRFNHSLRAQPRQSLLNEIEQDDDNAFKPLCGGPSKGEMLKRSKYANQILAEKRIGVRQDQRGTSDNSIYIPPSHIILSSPQPWQIVGSPQNAIKDPKECTAVAESVENNPKAVAQVEKGAAIASITVPSGSIENSPRKKRTLAWAAKRDRRNARRRSSPPMTRRRAALNASQNNSPKEQVEQPRDDNQASVPFLPIVEPSVDITDPSNSDETIQDALKRGNATRKGTKSKSRNTFAQLDMTLTEPNSTHQHDQDGQAASSIYDQSSQTESEGERNSFRPTIPPAMSSGSNTEDEQDTGLIQNTAIAAADKTSRIIIRKKAVKRKRAVKQSRKVPIEVANQSADNSVRPVAVQERVQKKKSKKDLLRGRPLFEGLRFVVIGYWTKVKMYTKLIEKHAGIIINASQPLANSSPAPLQPQFNHDHLFDNNPDRITHIVYCPHGMYTPDPAIVREAISTWKKESGKGFDLQKIHVIESRWISDCISDCLCKEDILSVKEYQIAV